MKMRTCAFAWARELACSQAGRGAALLLVLSGCQAESQPPDQLGGAGGETPGQAGMAGSDSSLGGAGGSQVPVLPECGEDPSVFVTASPAHDFGPGQDVGQEEFPDPILGPPKGGGTGAGSSHVLSLGEGGSVTVEFSGNYIIDGPGADFIVFENPFLVGGDPKNPYAELGEVAVSQDGETWLTFPCESRVYPYDSCAGWRPVLIDSEPEELELDPEIVGGDPFDLSELGLTWARYVRITDVADQEVEVFDLDAVAIIHSGCP